MGASLSRELHPSEPPLSGVLVPPRPFLSCHGGFSILPRAFSFHHGPHIAPTPPVTPRPPGHPLRIPDSRAMPRSGGPRPKPAKSASFRTFLLDRTGPCTYSLAKWAEVG